MSQSIKLSEKAEHALESLFPSDDPLDKADFDVVTYLNQIFPTEQSLIGLDEFIGQTNAQIDELNKDIRKTVRTSAIERTKTQEGVAEAVKSIAELSDKMIAVQTKAEESEALVQEICSGVKQLDCAKKNLTATFTALKRLHMLNSAVDQLQSMSDHRQYKQASNLLGAIFDLSNHFEEFRDIPRIEQLKDRVDTYKKNLQKYILEDFRMLGAAPDGIEDEIVDNFRSACDVLQVIGDEAKKELIDWVSKKQLEAYTAIFEPSFNSFETDPESPTSFENTERRFVWLRRQLQQFVDNFGNVFPSQWNIAGRICIDFCLLTHQHLIVILNEIRERGQLDVQLLVRTLQRTIAFEEELGKYYGTSSRIQKYHVPAFHLDPGSAEAIKDKYRNREALEHSDSQNLTDSPTLSFKGLISKCFASFMSQYVELERSNLQNLITKMRSEEQWDDHSSTANDRYPGSDEFFMYIKKSLKRCSKLDTRKVFLDITHEYRRGLRGFASMLADQIPLKTDKTPRLALFELKRVCRIVNTANYCIETLPQLQETLVSTIDDIYSDKIELEEEADAFHGLINRALDAAVLSTVFQLEQCLGTMTSLVWGNWDSVGDTSEYVQQIKNVLETQLPPLSSHIPSDYHFYFCINLAKIFIPSYVACFCKCKHINDLGAQQLLLDAQDLENVLKTMPRIGLDDSSQTRVPSSYTKLVKKEMGKAVVILKTIAAPNHLTGDTFRTLLRNGNFFDLAKIMDLKGIKKPDQQPIIEAYNKKVPQAQQMAPFLQEDSAEKKFSWIFDYKSAK